MDPLTLLLLWSGALLVVGTYTDLRWREVPDWLNFAAIAAGAGTRIIASVATGDWSYSLIGAMGFGAALAIAYAMFYLGQWGGGASKMLLALGMLLGIEPSSLDTIGIAFFINCLLVGAAYGIAWSAALALTHWSAFAKHVRIMFAHGALRQIVGGVMVMALMLAVLSFVVPEQLRLSLVLLAVSVPALTIIGVMIKAVELGCMLRRIAPERLTEGDWIVKDIVVGGKRIVGPRDLGVSVPQIKQLVEFARKGRIKTVLIKEGIPFVPSFLLAFIVTLAAGNLMLLLLP